MSNRLPIRPKTGFAIPALIGDAGDQAASGEYNINT
jgi:hypothetical protein